jgi:glucokinase
MSGRTFLGIEVGGTKLQLALGPGDGSIVALERRVIQPQAGAKGLLDQISSAYACLASADEPRPAAVGIGFGGPVDADRGVILRSHQVEGWEGFALADWAHQALGIPLATVQNDADTAGLGEARFGAGRGLSPIFYINIGSGIGGGLILDGRIYRGSGLGASEIGHLWIDEPDGSKTSPPAGRLARPAGSPAPTARIAGCWSRLPGATRPRSTPRSSPGPPRGETLGPSRSSRGQPDRSVGRLPT